MKRWLLMHLCMCIIIPAVADNMIPFGNLSGVIKDADTGLPLAGVSVYLSDIRVGTTTNGKGEFFINDIHDGFHLLEISHVGYITIAENVVVSNDTKLAFTLNRSVVESYTVIVTGTARATQLNKIPVQVSVVRKDELFQNTGSNIIEAISRKAGVFMISTGPAISKPTIRGLGNNRVLTIHDGVRQEGQQWGDEHGIEIDESSVSKVEILKGPASIIYGSDALGGVINILTHVPIPLNTIKVAAGTNMQSNNRQSGFNGNFSGNIKGFNWNVYGSVKQAGDYRNKYDGYVLNSKFNEYNAGGYAGLNGRWGFSHLLISSFNLKAGVIEGDRDSSGNFMKRVAGGIITRATKEDFKSSDPIIPYQHIRHFKTALDNSFRMGKSSLNVNIGWQHNRRQEFGDVERPANSELFFHLRTLTYTAQFQAADFSGWKPSIGVNGMMQKNSNAGEEQFVPDYVLQDIGGYLFLRKEINKFTLSGGARFDTRHMNVSDLQDTIGIKGFAFTRNFSNYSGSIGATWQASKIIHLKLAVARAFRAPSIPELASHGSHEGTNRYEYGNAKLHSETSTQIDAAIEFSTQHISFNLASYLNYFKNFIFYRKLQSVSGADSSVINDGEVLGAFTFDQQAAYLAGLEATLDIHPHPLDWLHIQNSFSMVSGRLRKPVSGSSNLPLMPAPKLLTEFRADIDKIPGLKNAYVKLEVENVFRQSRPFTGFNTETETPGYTLLNGGIGFGLSVNKIVKINIAFIVSNIADAGYQSHLSRLKYGPVNLATGRQGIYNMGRNFTLKINVPLTFGITKKV